MNINHHLKIIFCRCVLLVCCALFFSACSSTAVQEQPATAGADSIDDEDAFSDRFEKINRGVFVFNDKLDGWILKPIAKGYKAVLPDPVESGVRNFFSNLGEISNIVNDILQWKWRQAGNDTGRFLLNSTFGLAGLFEVAGHAGLGKSDGEDFGQTLAVWGVSSGPYIVLPFLGPSNFRDTAVIPVSWYTNPQAYLNPDLDRYLVAGLGILQTRADLLELEDMISGDRYTFIRDTWRQRRDYLIRDGEIEDDFDSDYEDF